MCKVWPSKGNPIAAPFTFFALCLLLIAGCNVPRTSIQTNKAPDYAKQPNRLFVFETVNPQLAGSSETFHLTLAKVLSNCGVAVDYASQSAQPALALDASTSGVNQAKTQIAQFRPDSILTVRWGKITTQGNLGTVVAASYLLELSDVDTRKAVWKSRVEVTRGESLLYSKSGIGENLASAVVGRMVQDQILPSSCQPPKI